MCVCWGGRGPKYPIFRTGGFQIIEEFSSPNSGLVSWKQTRILDLDSRTVV